MDMGSDTDDPGELLTTAQVAAELGCGINWVQKLIQAGRLQARRLGQIWVVPRAAIEAVRELKVGWPKGRARGKRKKG